MKQICFIVFLVLFLGSKTISQAQTFNFATSEASEILDGNAIANIAYTPETLTVRCNDWDRIISSPTTWNDTFKFKNMNNYVKFYVDHQYLITKYNTPIHYTFQLIYTLIGYTCPDTASSSSYVTLVDTLTIGYDNDTFNSPYQDMNLRRYSNFYKILVIPNLVLDKVTGLPADLSDPAVKNIKLEASIETQRYDKMQYGQGTGVTAPILSSTPVPADNYLDVSWNFGIITPVNYELEWTYVDDYQVSLTGGLLSPILPSSLNYNFKNNSTRIWLDSSHFRIPLTYPSGYLLYRVRAVRPDSQFYQYLIYGDWSESLDDDGNIGTTITDHPDAVYHIPYAYSGDSINWQYTISFAEGGKYKHVMSFYDGLLKNRQSITRFNSNLNKLLVTNNIYDFEGRPCIKTLPTPVLSTNFSYKHNVDLNSVSHFPYKANDFDTGLSVCPGVSIVPPFRNSALASLYYSIHNPDTTGSQGFVPDAQGYPFIQTVFEPGYADRVSAQGGAGPSLQIGNGNTIANYYVSPLSKPLNSLFGPNIGWSNFYTMTVSRDPNKQLSMSIKDYEGRQMASAMIGPGPSPSTHAITSIDVPGATFYKQDVLSSNSNGQSIDFTKGTMTADVDFFNEVETYDSVKYVYSFVPFMACSGQMLSVKGHYNSYITDECGVKVLSQETTIGVNGVVPIARPLTFNAPDTFFNAHVAKYHLHKSLAFNQIDIDSTLSEFFRSPNCFLTEPYFIKQSVDSAIFPCTGTDNADSTPCSKMKWEMMQQLFPDAVYGKYSTSSGYVSGTDNSIFSLLGCPMDTFRVTRYGPDSSVIHCYSDSVSISHGFILGGGFLPMVYHYQSMFGGIYREGIDSSYNDIGIYDTCFVQDTGVSRIRFYFTYLGNPDSMNAIFDGTFYGHGLIGNLKLVTNSDSLSRESGNITFRGLNVGHISFHDRFGEISTSLFEFRVSLTGDTITDSMVANLPSGDSIKLIINATTIDHYNTFHHFIGPYIADSLSPHLSSNPPCHYRFQDTCTVTLPDSIIVAHHLYRHLRSMPADSFIVVYNTALAEHNYSIAEALLPLHPQYCELKNCFNDSFKTLVTNLPSRKIAESLGLLTLANLVANDPIKSMMTASGLYPHPADTLRTFPGGKYSLDTFILMNAYCNCRDSVMNMQCVSSMFDYEIRHHLLITDVVKDYYFDNIVNAYFTNRQKIVDKLFMLGGSGCSHCALARMTLDRTGIIPPSPSIVIDSASTDTAFGGSITGGWGTSLLTDSISVLQDKATRLYHYNDSVLAYSTMDTIVAHLANCIGGSTALAARIKDSLEALYLAGLARTGNYTYPQLLYVLNSCGVSMNDICNPYTINCNQVGTTPPKPVNDCLPDRYYTSLNALLNTDSVQMALSLPGSSGHAFSLDTMSNYFERKIGRALGYRNYVGLATSYDTSLKLYTLYIYSAGSSDTVSLYIHSSGCGEVFSGTGPFTLASGCINSIDTLISSTGMINQFSFNLHVSGGASCDILAWIDSIPTMSAMDNDLAGCVPCTKMRELYNRFKDTLQVYQVYGTDHPLYNVMLGNFMNYYLQQQFTANDYETFIQSCALADSLKMPLYTGYATYQFSNTTDMNSFMYMMNHVDPLYTFDESYRDSTLDSGIITLAININKVPDYELWRYRDTLFHYPGTYLSRIVNAPFAATQAQWQIGFISTLPAYSFNARGVGMIYDTTYVKFRGPYHKKLWTDGHFSIYNYFSIIADTSTPPNVLARGIDSISSYFKSHSVPATIFTPHYQTTINADYYKPEKQAYLNYVYHLQDYPDYQIIDSIQSYFLPGRIPSYSTLLPGYSQSATSGVFTNLYLGHVGVNGRYFDTLQMIFRKVSSTTMHIFSSSNHVEVSVGYPRQLASFRCSDGTYWYRYFGAGDTLYNVYVAMPAYIPKATHPLYRVVTVIPTPGDSMNRSFTLQLVGYYGDTVTAVGRTSFVLGKSIELDNVLLGQARGGANLPVNDTFDNCERQRLLSAVQNGIAKYENYFDSVKRDISLAFRNYLTTATREKFYLGYMNDEFNYTLYHYDRAGNLQATVSPAGVHPIPDTGNSLNYIDVTRMHNTPTLCPRPNITKINAYNYNSINKVTFQKTVDGGNTRFFYDAAGRLVFSQNARQAFEGYYTYNIYDQQSRVIETGEAQFGCTYFDEFVRTVSTMLPPCYHSYMYGGSEYISPDPYFIHNLEYANYDSVVRFIREYYREDVVMTIYDTAATNLGRQRGLEVQQNLRKRVSAVKFFDSLLANTTVLDSYTYATHYSYDLEGNVKTLVQDFPLLESMKQRYKRVDYDYDMISGKVNMLSYNRGWPDQYYQRYTYDADNRITEVNSSGDGYIWKRDAAYAYYDHGPLARVTLGDLRVQGIDYAYTIQGWLKSVNSDTLSSALEMGHDGLVGNVTARDAVAYTIDYFSGDYSPITAHPLQHITPTTLSLYNGNIARQTMAINAFPRLNKKYVYDQLNRIHSADYATINTSHGTLSAIPDYHSNYSYDPDGNLLKLVRNGNGRGSGAEVMDNLDYQYNGIMQTNQLKLVTDSATAVYGNDILYNVDNLHPRYAYDEIGNTTKDLVSGQDTIEWNLYNKVTYAVNNGNNSSLYFAYDGAGNRVYKRYDKEVNDLGRDSLITRTDYYVHDAQGNILAIYHGNEVATGSSHMSLAWRGSDFSLAEHEIYGSSRLGSKSYYPDQVGISNNVSGQSDTTLLWSPQPWYSLEYQDLIRADSTDVNGNELKTGNYARHIIGQKQYELTDHLGDLLATISDKRANDSLTGLHIPHAVDTVASWKPVVVSATDYYPFGMQMPGRSIADESTHCFYTSYTETVPYFTSITDTFVVSPPPYNAIGSATIYPSGSLLYVDIAAPGDGVAIHVDGLYVGVPQTMYLYIDACPRFSTFTITSGSTISSSSIISAIGPFTQALTFTPGADTACVSVTGSGTAFRLFSITLPRVDSFILRDAVTLVCNEDQYHYGYNGKTKDNEWAGVGNYVDYGFRGLDTRIARFISIDPLSSKFPMLTPYQFCSLNPIMNIDLDGREGIMFGIPEMIETAGDITRIGLETEGEVATRPSAPLSIPRTQAKPQLSDLTYHGDLGMITKSGSIGGLQPLILPRTVPQMDNLKPSEICDNKELKKGNVFYATYTKTKVYENGSTSTYSGRTSGLCVGEEPTLAEAVMAIKSRDYGHVDLNSEGYSAAKLDKATTDRYAIRGREQHLIDYYGGAKSEQGYSRNAIRAVSRNHQYAFIYDFSAKVKFGSLPNNNPIDKK